MKKLLFFSGLLLTGSVFSQAPAEHSNFKGTQAQSPAYANDVIIENSPTISQRNVKLSVAFNGWLYAAFSTVDSLNNKGGLTIRSSKDNGATWKTIDAYLVTDIRYETHDIVVAGTDTNNLTLYMLGVNHSISGNNYTMFVDRYDARTGSFSGSNFNQSNGNRRIYDVAIASDYLYPAYGASPYSIAFIYSSYSSAKDSIGYVASLDGGNTFSVRKVVATTSSYFRNVSLSYGKCASGSNGRYFAAWEQMSTAISRVGHIYTSRTDVAINDTWTTPKNLDSLSSSMINLCRNPEIATQFNNIDNDSSSLTAVVLVERDFLNNGVDYDVLGLYNKKAHYKNNWNILNVISSVENDMQPDISYDPGYNNFLAVYYDSTNARLPYVVNNFNLTSPNSWATISTQYNDVSTNLKAPYPRVEINPAALKTAHVWNAEGLGTKGVSMFDAEYNLTGIENIVSDQVSHYVSPNPANHQTSIYFHTQGINQIQLRVYDAVGQLIFEKEISQLSGDLQSEKINTAEWKDGVYLYQLFDGIKTHSGKIIVAH